MYPEDYGAQFGGYVHSSVSEEHTASNVLVADIICCQWWSPTLHNLQPLAVMNSLHAATQS